MINTVSWVPIEKQPVVLIWHESGKVLTFDSYSFVPLKPVLLSDGYAYYLREEILTDYRHNIICTINTVFRPGLMSDEDGVGYAANLSTLNILDSSDKTFIDNTYHTITPCEVSRHNWSKYKQ